MCRGYHRREEAALHRTRLVLTEIRNGLRPPGAEPQTPEEVMRLSGDAARPSAAAPLTDEEYLASLQAVVDLDKDLL